MKVSNRQLYARLDNQENQPAAKSSSPHPNVENISGWDDDKPLLQYNLNTLGTRLNKFKENKDNRKANVLQCIGESRTSHRRRRTKIIASSASQRNFESYVQPDPQSTPQQAQETLKYEFSNIEVLKFQAKHLQKQQISNNRFPTFSGFTQSQVLQSPAVENLTQFEISQIFEPARKLRTESTKRRKREPSQSQNTGSITQISLATANSKFYRTLANEFKHPHLIIEPAIINYNSTCQNKSIKLDVSALTNGKKQEKQGKQGRQEEFKTIHWKRNKPFTKFFHSKRNKSRNASELYGSVGGGCGNGGKMGMKQVEGRKLHQLLTLNRQVIELQDF